MLQLGNPPNNERHDKLKYPRDVEKFHIYVDQVTISDSAKHSTIQSVVVMESLNFPNHIGKIHASQSTLYFSILVLLAACIRNHVIFYVNA
jgi:hypothetical protein